MPGFIPVASTAVPVEVTTDQPVILRALDGFVLQQRASDGYWNATAMCQAAGKLMANYTRNAETKGFMEELAGSMRIRIDLLRTVQVTGPNAERGTWVHPKVAIHLAQWCSPRFAVQVSFWIDELLTTGRVELHPALLPQTYAEALRQLADSTEAAEILRLENSRAVEQNEELVTKTEELGQAVKQLTARADEQAMLAGG